jgi:plasmid stability protein
MSGALHGEEVRVRASGHNRSGRAEAALTIKCLGWDAVAIPLEAARTGRTPTTTKRRF